MKTETVIKLAKPEDAVKYISNIASRIAVAMLRSHGEYRYIMDGKKYYMVVEAA